MSELEISRLERELDDYYYRLKDADKENARLRADLTESAIVEARLREALVKASDDLDDALTNSDVDSEKVVAVRNRIDAVLAETKGDTE